MRISRATLQKYFEKPLPGIAEIADAYTFHAFEIDSIDGDILDVKVLPNRAADCNSEAGLARELSAILEIPTTLPRPSGTLAAVTVSLAQINGILGADFSQGEVEEVFKRLGLETKTAGDVFTITPPASRPDITVLQDLVEEVGRMLGYDRVLATELPPIPGVPDQARFRGIERMKDALIEQGFTEVSTQSFVATGDTLLANPLDQTRPALRTSLEENLQEVLARAKQYEALILAPKQKLKLFEVGSVFPKEGEYLELRMTERVPEWGETAGISDNLTSRSWRITGRIMCRKNTRSEHTNRFQYIRSLCVTLHCGSLREQNSEQCLESFPNKRATWSFGMTCLIHSKKREKSLTHSASFFNHLRKL